MTFNEIVAWIVTDTTRPDLGLPSAGGDSQIPNAVFAATSALHLLDYFWRDIVSADVIFDSAQYIQQLDIRTMVRFRAVAYFRKWDPNYSPAQLNPTILPPLYNGVGVTNIDLALKHLEIVDLGRGGIFDSYGSERQDVCYATGSTLNIKSSTPLSQGKIGYYAHPELDIANTGAGYRSWIADFHPWAIIYSAEVIINTTTGNLEKAKELARGATINDPGGLRTQAIAALRESNIEAEGR